jgi:predicted phage-related endonuclease
MTLSTAALAKRRNYMTASDVPAILSVDPYRTPGDVLASKIHELAPSEPGPAARLGTLLEDGLIDVVAETQHLTKITRNQWRVHKGGIIAATLDAVGITRTDEPAGIEAKSTGLLNPFANTEEWGEEGTDQVPSRVLIQASTQLLADDRLRMVYIPALIGAKGYRCYAVDAAQKETRDLMATIEEQVHEWWEKHVVKRLPLPEHQPASLDTLKRVVRTAGKVLDWSGDVEIGMKLTRLATLNEQIKKAEEEAEQIKALLIGQLGDAEGALVTVDGEPKAIKYASITTSRLDTTRLKAAHPALVEAFTSPSSYRKFTVVKRTA